MLTQLDIAIAEFMREQQELATHEPGHWRCFYNNHGDIVDTAFGPPWPVDLPYVVLSAEQQERVTYRDKIINGKLVIIDRARSDVLKLCESPDGEFCAAANHMSIVLDAGENYSDVKYYTQVTDRHS